MKIIVTLWISVLITVNAYAQQIRGKVLDQNKVPVAGASIKNLSTSLTTQTNQNGEFAIAADAKHQLEVSSVGYEKQQISASNTPLLITLTETLSTLEDAVVIGYQTVTKKKSTAAVSTISGKDLENIPAASFETILQGRLPGVNVQNVSGSPGSMGSVYVRGSTGLSNNYDEAQILSSPLYVVDGVPQPTEQYANLNTGTGTNFLAGLNPNDIESVSVLRDASAAAIYGSRAANGVILITTKKGVVREPVVVINGYSGLTKRPDLRPMALGSAERGQKMSMLNNQLTLEQLANLPYLLTDSLNPAYNGNTNFQDLFYQQGQVNNADLSVSGGGGSSTYRFSGNYYNEEGIIKQTGFTRFATRLNLATRAMKEKLTINPIVAYTFIDRPRGNGSSTNPFPWNAGNMPSSLYNLSDQRRDYYMGAYDGDLDKNVTNQLSLNLNMNVQLTPKLTLTSQTAFQYNTGRRDYSRPSFLNANLGNSASSWTSDQQNWRTSNYLNYSDTFGKHSLTVLVGQDVERDKYQETSAEGYYGSSDQIKVVQGFLQDYIGAYSDYQAWGLLSYYSRLSYDFDDRYIFSGSIRTDGSSRFGRDSRYGWFPSASAAWLISEESFMEDNSTFSLLKLRASYGTVGNLPRDNYLPYSNYRVNAGGYAGNTGGASYNGVTAVTPNFTNGVAQDGLTWEKGTSWNIGTDIELWGGKYSIAADIYNKETKNQLFAVQLPVSTGYDYAMTNSVAVRNAGAELVIGANPLSSTSPVSWRSNFNISYNKNQIMALPNGGRDLVMNGDRFDASHILSIGSPINAFYLFQTLGVYSTINDVPVNPYSGALYGNGGAYGAGMFHLKDLDGDYFLDSFRDGINPDKMPIGDPNPKWTGGWTNAFTYKNFTFSFFINFTLDRDILNLYEADAFATTFNNEQFASKAYPDLSGYNIWAKDGDQAEYAKLDLGTYRYYYTSAQTFFLEDGSYVRLKNIIGSYDFGKRLTERLGLNRLRVYGIVDNLLTWKASKKLPDPEAVNIYGEYNGFGYPMPKKFTIGLEITL
ncbi:SusC/RagA family TonB-linked outer membrane protein [Sphingobacterium oryzagri]|uniref:SusC/RagA family TonB-linked outer membrane protein n=1 Tax=Sphingobacterium oryzagri TaxID=3025669 RepID=A0ABY7WH39_9SPHI|nr:SusC/RagA family TonB-linked outer membrane protein [Sphingobacterium sp. KACC 22765]WDF68947.1 SusC/RagA family TonB-linked outer membrane protein [Sphingobacterium sp. KACC 22765]